MLATFLQSSLPRAHRPLAWSLLLEALSRVRVGTLRVEAPDGERHAFHGADPGPEATLTVHDRAAAARVLGRGDVGLGAAYMSGAWSSPDLTALLVLAGLNEAHFSARLEQSAAYRMVQRARHALRRNSRAGSRRNIEAHYDLGNDFFALWLDPSMTYSCGLFRDEDTDLEQAQRAKYRRILEMLAPSPGDHVLEIGCGFGGFAVEAARAGCRVTGLTLSRRQLEYARRRVQRLGLGDLVELRLQDYRDVRGQFDHVASIEMFEAVGEAYWSQFFGCVHDRLKPGGRAALQVITIDEDVFERYRLETDFIQRHVFPGGMLPSPAAFERRVAAAGLRTAERAFHGLDYAHTLALWHRRFIDVAPQVRALGYDTRFIRLWRFYLAYCEAGFRIGRVNLMHAGLTR